MNNEKTLSTLTHAELLAMRDELITAIKKEQYELSRLNDEYRRYGKKMGSEAYNATVASQADAKQRMIYLEERYRNVKEALRTAWSNEPKDKKMGALKEMTLLDHFAGLAMQAIVASMNNDDARAGASDASDDLGKTMAEMYAHIAYTQAAAMIAERNEIMNEKP